MIGVELHQDAAAPADLGDDRHAGRVADPGRGPARHHRPCARGPGTGRPSSRRCSTTAPCSRSPRWASSSRCSCRSPWRSSAATRSPVRRRRGRCATCWPGPVGRTQLLVAKLVTVVAFVLHRRRSSSPRSPTSRAGCCSATRRPPAPSVSAARPSPRRSCRWRTALAIGYVVVSMLGVAAVALFFSTLTTSSLGAALGTIGLLIASTRAARAGRRRRAAPVPADPLLAVLRRPVPRPDPLAQRASAGSGSSSATCVVFLPRRLGQLHHQGHHRLADRAAASAAHRRSAARQLRTEHRGQGGEDDRVTGESAVCGGRARADFLDQQVERTGELRRIDGGDNLVIGGPDRHPLRTVGGLVAGVQPPQQVTVRGQLLARRSGTRRRRSRPSSAWLDPCCGEPRVSTRRATAAPPWSRTQSRATTPPAE